MKLVQPIRDTELIDKFKKKVKSKSLRDYIIVLIGLNTGLRIGDILSLYVKDVYNKSFIQLNEQKTGKFKRFPISHISLEINDYIETKELPLNGPLFPSRQVNNKGKITNITTVQAYRRLKPIAEELGIEEFGTHSLRKSFGYHYYRTHKDIAKLMEIFNHSNQAVTMRYIGVTQEEIEDSLKSFYL